MTNTTPNKKAAGGMSTTATKSICTIDSTGSLIQSHGRSLWTTSQLVAEKFEKRHDNILRAVVNLDCSDEFRRLNFEELNYLDEQGKPRKSYDISRDGFSILAMGFTGKSAAKWKEQNNHPPAKPGVFKMVSRSKRLNGVANAAPTLGATETVANHLHSPSCSNRLSSFS